MYISYQGQQAIHQDIVDDALQRSERRRLLNEAKGPVDVGTEPQKSQKILRGLVSAVLAAAARS